MDFDPLSYAVIEAAMAVHSAPGPGLFEEVYKVCFKRELNKRNFKVLSEVALPVTYDGV